MREELVEVAHGIGAGAASVRSSAAHLALILELLLPSFLILAVALWVVDPITLLRVRLVLLIVIILIVLALLLVQLVEIQRPLVCDVSVVVAASVVLGILGLVYCARLFRLLWLTRSGCRSIACIVCI